MSGAQYFPGFSGKVQGRQYFQSQRNLKFDWGFHGVGGHVDAIEISGAGVATSKVSMGWSDELYQFIDPTGRTPVAKDAGPTSLIGWAGGNSGKLIKDSGIPLAGLRDTSAGATLATARNLVVKWMSVSTVDIDAERLELFDSSGNGTAVNTVNLTADISTSGANGRGTGIAETGNVRYYLFVGDGGGTPYFWFDTRA